MSGQTSLWCEKEGLAQKHSSLTDIHACVDTSAMGDAASMGGVCCILVFTSVSRACDNPSENYSNAFFFLRAEYGKRAVTYLVF